MSKSVKATCVALFLIAATGANCEASGDYRCEQIELQDEDASVEIVTLHCEEIPKPKIGPDGEVVGVEMTEQCWPIKKTLKGKAKYSLYRGRSGIRISGSLADFILKK